jgi:DNA (cytosine-5)-methyltransferase 1
MASRTALQTTEGPDPSAHQDGRQAAKGQRMRPHLQMAHQAGTAQPSPAHCGPDRPMLSLFTGAGGLDIGLEAAGFRSALCVEIDQNARETIRKNSPKWTLSEPGDIHDLRPEEILEQSDSASGQIALLAGGPPCQPFSKSANWTSEGVRGLNDPRAATLVGYLKVVATSLPQVLLLENVRGLAPEQSDTAAMTLLREGIHEINDARGTRYALQVLHVNAADFGVPQRRERVFLVASIDGRVLSLPAPTHRDESGWLAPVTTTWDAIGHLDSETCPTELNLSGKWAELLPSIPEGRNYLWHTPKGGGEPLFGWRTRYWSFLLKLAKDKPSWTLQAEPGPATGPFHWRNRLLSISELACLQTFPKRHTFAGNRRAAQRQIGNAVPCAIGELLGLEIRRQLLGDQNVGQELTLIPRHRTDCPSEQPPSPVPTKYLNLRRPHLSHPGKGLGPGRVWMNARESNPSGG